MEYRALIELEGSRTTVEFPDCPGCATFAEAEEDVVAVAGEALEGWLKAHLAGGESPPRPNSASDVKVGRGVQCISVAVSPALAVRLSLRWAREEKGISQGELAERAGVSRQLISRLESGDGNVTVGTLETLAKKMELQSIVGITIGPRLAARVGFLLLKKGLYTTVGYTASEPLQITVTDPERKEEGGYVGYVYQPTVEDQPWTDDKHFEATARRIVDRFFHVMRGPGRPRERVI